MKLDEVFVNWLSWKLWRNAFETKHRYQYFSYNAVDVYKRFIYHIGPLKIVFKQFVETRYEYKGNVNG